MAEEINFTIEAVDLVKGLRVSNRSPRDAKFLVTSNGVKGRNGALAVLKPLTRMDTGVITDTFPYPQVFAFANVTIVCSEKSIYEYVNSTLVLKYTSSLSCSLWSAVDFYDYIYLTNGTDAVIRNAVTQEYELTSTLPAGRAICNFNGQVLLAESSAALLRYDSLQTRNVSFYSQKANFHIALSSDMQYCTNGGWDDLGIRMSKYFTVREGLTTVNSHYTDTVMSKDGKYQFIAGHRGLSTEIPIVTVSSDYGESWTDTFVWPGVTYAYLILACSDSGKDVVLSAGNTANTSRIYTSTDYGLTWVLRLSSLTDCFNLSMSGNGERYIADCDSQAYINGVYIGSVSRYYVGSSACASGDGTVYLVTGVYYYKAQVFKNGVPVYTIDSPFMLNKLFSSIVVARDNSDIVVIVVTSNAATYNCVLVSHTGGTTWTQVDLTTSHDYSGLTKAAISDDGKNIVVGCGRGTTSGETGWYSSDYGVTFSRASTTPITTLSDFSLCSTGQYGVASKDGNYSVPIYFTEDYGATWKIDSLSVAVYGCPS